MRFYNGTIASYQTKCIHFSLQASKSLPVKFQQKDSRRDQGLSGWTELSGTDKKPSRSSVAQNYINRFKSILQKSETTHHSSATINTSIKLSPTRRSASGQGERPGGSPGSRTLRTMCSVKIDFQIWEKCRPDVKLTETLQMTLKRDIIVVRTSRFWYDNGMLWYCNCCFKNMNGYKKCVKN